MARLLTSGAEWNDATAEGAVALPSGISISSVNPRTGTYAWRAAATSSSMRWNFTGATAVTYYARCYHYLSGLPTGGSQAQVLAFGFNTPSEVVALNISGTGAVIVRDVQNITDLFTSADGFVSTGSYVLFELAFKVGTGATDYVEARVAGSSVYSSTTLNLTDTAPSALFALGGDTVLTQDVDDVALNDSSGAVQNTWVGESKIVLLRPTADSAVGTGWTLGNTTATGGNAWQREDNIPPDSATDLTTTADATQIRNATSNANVNYDATMTTYTAAGVTGTVNVVVPFVATGAPVVTSAKAGTVGVVSNPAIANISLGAGGTSGAFWSGVAVGTYPTGNKWSFGTTTYAPTVTLGTAPVMRITQVTASTRIAVVTEMGIYVDYTPAVIIPPTPLVHQSVPFYPRPSRPA